MEIKHRINNTVYKQRAKLTDFGANAILSDSKELLSFSRHVEGPDQDQMLIDDIQRSASQQNLQRAAVITYLREAWLGTIDDRLRITFDSNCQSYRPDAFGEIGSNQGTCLLDPNLCIMEVKFNHAIPCWIRDVLVDQHLQLQRFSKYASGVMADPDVGMNRLKTGKSLVPVPVTTDSDLPAAPLDLIRRSPDPLFPVVATGNADHGNSSQTGLPE